MLVMYDSTHFEVHDASKPTEKKEKAPKKHDRKSKEERAAWLAEQAEIEANLSTYEKKLEVQLTIPTSTLWKDMLYFNRVTFWVTFIYNTCKLAVDRLNAKLNEQNIAA